MIYLILALGLGLVGYFAHRKRSKSRARADLLASPLPHSERALISETVPLTRKLPPALRPSLEGKINLFLDQVEFIGCNGLEVSEEMQLSIATQACLLVVGTETWYDNLTTILIYPGAFKSIRAQQDGYVVTETETVRIGESWSHGPVILSWAHTQDGAADPGDGHNVVFHEFAHQLDDLSGRTDGIPILNRDQDGEAWEAAFVDAFRRLTDAIEQGRRTAIDPYGANGYEEFFAVSVEMFFEKPAALQRSEPDVYDQLSKYFKLDPATW